MANLEELARCAEEAREALIKFSAAARAVGMRVNLVRPIELISAIAERASLKAIPTDESRELLSRSLTASLEKLRADPAVVPDAVSSLQAEIKRALAAENGAKGGRKMTDRRRAALAELHRKRREAAAARRAEGNAERELIGRGGASESNGMPKTS